MALLTATGVPCKFVTHFSPAYLVLVGAVLPGGGAAGVHEAEAEEAQVVQEDLEDQ